MAFTYVLAVLTAFSLALPAVADDFTDFRIPQHRVLGLSARADGSFNTSTHRPLNGRYDSWRSNGDLAASLFALTESEQRRLSIQLSASIDGQYDAEESRNTEPNDIHWTGSDRGRGLDEEWDLSLDGRWYPWTIPLGLRGALDAAGRTSQSWRSDSRTYYQASNDDWYQDDYENWDYRYHVSGDVGLGWGKVRDVTGVMNAHLIADRLLRDHTVAQTLTPATRQQVAELFYRNSDYGYRHEFSDKYFWHDVEQVLRRDPALLEAPLDAYALYRLAEPNHSGNIYREAGWFVGPMLRGEHENEIRRYWTRNIRPDYTNEYFFKDVRTSDELLGGAMAEYHRPFGYKWQLDLASTLLFSARADEEHGLDWSTGAGLSYFIADRWSAELNLDHSRFDRMFVGYYGDDQRYRYNAWRVASRMEVAYHIEDRWALALSLYYSQNGSRRDPPPEYYSSPQKMVDSDASVHIGVVHHIRGIGLPFGSPHSPRFPRSYPMSQLLE